MIELATFTPEYLDAAAALSRADGWPHRREDWAFTAGLSQGIVALEGGRLVGTTMLTRFGTDSAAVSLVIVDRSMRGRGLGRRLLRAALDLAGERTCRLTATPDGLPLYESLGFRPVGTIEQHQGILSGGAAAGGPEWAGAQTASALAALDRAAKGFDRSALVDALVAQGRIAMLERGGQPSGFAVLREFGRDLLTGPVVAATRADAEALLGFVFAAHPSRFMRVDTPAERGLAPFLAANGLARVDTGVAMVRGTEPPRQAGAPEIFALASQALG